jgi:hypothetical protein
MRLAAVCEASGPGVRLPRRDRRSGERTWRGTGAAVGTRVAFSTLMPIPTVMPLPGKRGPADETTAGRPPPARIVPQT